MDRLDTVARNGNLMTMMCANANNPRLNLQVCEGDGELQIELDRDELAQGRAVAHVTVVSMDGTERTATIAMVPARASA
jgi:hypothetical protein